MGVPMVTRTVLVPIDLYAEIVNYADSHEISWAAAVRTLTEKGLRLFSWVLDWNRLVYWRR